MPKTPTFGPASTAVSPEIATDEANGPQMFVMNGRPIDDGPARSAPTTV
jgi:hypothetical protein